MPRRKPAGRVRSAERGQRAVEAVARPAEQAAEGARRRCLAVPPLVEDGGGVRACRRRPPGGAPPPEARAQGGVRVRGPVAPASAARSGRASVDLSTRRSCASARSRPRRAGERPYLGAESRSRRRQRAPRGGRRRQARRDRLIRRSPAGGGFQPGGGGQSGGCSSGARAWSGGDCSWKRAAGRPLAGLDPTLCDQLQVEHLLADAEVEVEDRDEGGGAAASRSGSPDRRSVSTRNDLRPDHETAKPSHGAD